MPRKLLIFKLLAIDLLKKKIQLSSHSKKLDEAMYLKYKAVSNIHEMRFFAKHFLDSKKDRFSKRTPSRYLKEQTSRMKFTLKCHKKEPNPSLCRVLRWEKQYFFHKAVWHMRIALLLQHFLSFYRPTRYPLATERAHRLQRQIPKWHFHNMSI